MKELAKLRALTEGTAKGKNPTVESSLDSLLLSLHEVKSRIEAGTVTEDTFALLAQTVEARKKEIDEKQKEVYNAIAKVGKALDKVWFHECAFYFLSVTEGFVQKFTQPLPKYDPLFASDSAKEALERTIALHFLRTGQFSTAETFIQVRGSLSTSFLKIEPSLGIQS